MKDLRLTYVGGPTLLVQIGGLRLLTDPTFDPAGTEFRGAGAYLLRKTHGPGLPPSALGRVDAVLLSHDRGHAGRTRFRAGGDRPVHFEDWEHFSEGRPVIDETFKPAGLGDRLRWLPRGVETAD